MRPGFLGNTDDLPLARAAKAARASAGMEKETKGRREEVSQYETRRATLRAEETFKNVSLRTRSARELDRLRKRDAAIKSAGANMARIFADPKDKTVEHPIGRAPKGGYATVGRRGKLARRDSKVLYEKPMQPKALAKGKPAAGPAMLAKAMTPKGKPAAGPAMLAKAMTPKAMAKGKPRAKGKPAPKAPVGKPLPDSASSEAKEKYQKVLAKLAQKRAEKAAKREEQREKWAGRPKVLKRWAARDAANRKRLAEIAIRQAKEDAKDEKRREDIMGRSVGTPEGKAARERQLKAYEERLANRRLKRAREKAAHEEAMARAIVKREKWQQTKDKFFNTVGRFLGWEKRTIPGLSGYYGYGYHSDGQERGQGNALVPLDPTDNPFLGHYENEDGRQHGQGTALVPLDPADNPFLGGFGHYGWTGKARLGSFEHNRYSGQGYQGFENEFELDGFENEFELDGFVNEFEE